MSLFILQNQHQYFLTKDKQWEDGRDRRRLFKTNFKDEAVNQLFEANTRDVSLRISIVECDASDQGLPLIDETQLAPLTLEATPEEDATDFSEGTEATIGMGETLKRQTEKEPLPAELP